MSALHSIYDAGRDRMFYWVMENEKMGPLCLLSWITHKSDSPGSDRSLEFRVSLRPNDRDCSQPEVSITTEIRQVVYLRGFASATMARIQGARNTRNTEATITITERVKSFETD